MSALRKLSERLHRPPWGFTRFVRKMARTNPSDRGGETSELRSISSDVPCMLDCFTSSGTKTHIRVLSESADEPGRQQTVPKIEHKDASVIEQVLNSWPCDTLVSCYWRFDYFTGINLPHQFTSFLCLWGFLTFVHYSNYNVTFNSHL